MGLSWHIDKIGGGVLHGAQWKGLLSPGHCEVGGGAVHETLAE